MLPRSAPRLPHILLLAPVALLSLSALFALPTSASACALLSGTPPQGYGSAENFFSGANELIIDATCGSDTFRPLTGSAETNANNFAVYELGYLWTGSTWQPFDQIPRDGAVRSGSWIFGNARADDPYTYRGDPTYFVAYACHWTNNQWKCGCQNQVCAQPAWQLQGVERPSVRSSGTGVSGEVAGANTPEDWVTAKEIMLDVQRDLERLPQQSFNVAGGNYPQYQRLYENAGNVTIENIHWQVLVQPANLDGSLFRVRGCDTLTFRNVRIDLPSDIRLNDVLRANNCERAVLENVVITGPVDYYTINLEFVDEVTVKNLAILAETEVAGGGVSVSWGRYWNGNWSYTGQGQQTPGESGTVTMESVYLKGGTRGNGNRDGIYILSPQGATISNVFTEYFEPFPVGRGVRSPGLDAPIDVSHRRDDISNATIVVENSVFFDSYKVKTSGGAQRTLGNEIIWRNNLFLNARINAYSASPVTFTNNVILNSDALENTIAGVGSYDSGLPDMFYFDNYNGRALHRFENNVIYGDGVRYIQNTSRVPDSDLRNTDRYRFRNNSVYNVTGFSGNDTVRSLSGSADRNVENAITDLGNDLKRSGDLRASLTEVLRQLGAK
jgi:hypothetical protein